MREIKFRAWDKATNEMIYKWDTMGWGHNLLKPFETTNFARMEIMQYTGLKDKNGVEIYEGDICEVRDEPAKVEYSGSCFVFVIGNREVYVDMENNNCEIIGNIYENPELLTPNNK